jgi:pimeloyl-ACP methyl ester carboxylesterase
MRPLLIAVFTAAVVLVGCFEEEPGAKASHCTATERHPVVTADGAEVVLHRHPSEGGRPVVIVHGISSNHHCWDLSAGRSLGTYLADQGIDAWLLDLRGHGDSRFWADGHRLRSGWTVDDYGLQDLPAAIDYVRRETGQPQVGLVGHSLGGMVAAIYASSYPGGDKSLSSLVAVGSPMEFSDPDPVLLSGLLAARIYGPFLPVVPSPLAARIQGALPGKVLPVDDLLFNDISEDMRTTMYRRIVSPMVGGELKQFGQSLRTGTFTAAGGTVDYGALLGRIETPTLVIAGRADRVAPPDRVLAYYQGVGAAEKAFVIAGRAYGFSVDYGHLDLPLGDHAQEEIFPLISEWVDRPPSAAR